MSTLKYEFDINGEDFSTAGEASSAVKATLKKMGVDSAIVRKVAISMYEAEINTVIHGKGGKCEVVVTPTNIDIIFSDKGPGIADVDKAMQEGFSTADNAVRELGFGAGMGLPNIKKYTDGMEVISKVGEGTTLKLHINM